MDGMVTIRAARLGRFGLGVLIALMLCLTSGGGPDPPWSRSVRPPIGGLFSQLTPNPRHWGLQDGSRRPQTTRFGNRMRPNRFPVASYSRTSFDGSAQTAPSFTLRGPCRTN